MTPYSVGGRLELRRIINTLSSEIFKGYTGLPYIPFLCVGIELSSRSVSRQVLSPLQSLTSVFGMGTGGPSALKTPTDRLRGVSAMSYLPGPSPDKYCRHCRA